MNCMDFPLTFNDDLFFRVMIALKIHDFYKQDWR